MARQSVQGTFTLIAFALVLIAGLVTYGLFFKSGTTQTIDTGSNGGGNTAVNGGSIGMCPASMETAFQGDAINPLNTASTEYQAVTARLIPNGDFKQFTSYTFSSSSTRTSAVNLKCGKDYTMYFLPTQDSFAPIKPKSLGVVSGSSVQTIADVPDNSLLKVIAYDNFNKQFVYSNDSTSTSYANLPITFESTTNSTTATSLTANDVLDWEFTVTTQNANAQFGNANLGLYIAVDADKTDYKEPTVWMDGVQLQEVKNSGELSSNDLAVLSSYEYIYKLPANLDDKPHKIRVYVAPKDGVNPSADIKLRFVGKSYYVKADGYTIGEDIFKDTDSSELLTATPQVITLDIA